MSAILFLQGPLGPFFAKLARCASTSTKTHKINFNGGDRYYGYADYQVDFVGNEPEWPGFLKHYLQKHEIKLVFVYGDCRYYHKEAKKVCRELGVSFWVFEEGYLRPNFITMEQGGVNAFSGMDCTPATIESYQANGRQPGPRVGRTFRHRAWYASSYYLASQINKDRFSGYHHHRNRSGWKELGCWLRSFERKLRYKITEWHKLAHLIKQWDGHFFLYPLQTMDDFQMRQHSDYLSMEHSIEKVITSFAKSAATDDALVIKHHPMDRGFCDYRGYIKTMALQQGVSDRVIYCYDVPVPDLLRHTKGVVTVNSTVGISALVHHVPTKVIGRAVYDIEGLTHQGSLESFWRLPQPVSQALFRQFRSYLYEQTQVDGSFYKRIDHTCDEAWKRVEDALLVGVIPDSRWRDRVLALRA